MILVCKSATVGMLVGIESPVWFCSSVCTCDTCMQVSSMCDAGGDSLILVWFCSSVCTRDTCVQVSNSCDAGGDRKSSMVLFICMHM